MASRAPRPSLRSGRATQTASRGREAPGWSPLGPYSCAGLLARPLFGPARIQPPGWKGSSAGKYGFLFSVQHLHGVGNQRRGTRSSLCLTKDAAGGQKLPLKTSARSFITAKRRSGIGPAREHVGTAGGEKTRSQNLSEPRRRLDADRGRARLAPGASRTVRHGRLHLGAGHLGEQSASRAAPGGPAGGRDDRDALPAGSPVQPAAVPLHPRLPPVLGGAAGRAHSSHGVSRRYSPLCRGEAGAPATRGTRDSR